MSPLFSRTTLAISLVGTVACSSSENDAANDETPGSGGSEGSGGSSAAPDAAPPQDGLGDPFSVSIVVPDVEPGVENTLCVQVRLNNPEPIKVGRLHNTLTDGSHHFVVSAVEDPNETEREPYACDPFRAPIIGAPLTVTQKHDDVIPLPAGVGFALGANQLMHLEMHYINTGSETVDVEGMSQLFPINEDEDVQEASFLIIGDLGFEIPPNSQYQSDFSYVALPEEFAGVSFYAATGHTHRFGTGTHLQVAPGEGTEGTTIYDPAEFIWEEPVLEQYDPPVVVPEGGGFRFNCSWNNTTDMTLTFGESALEEMCIFWAYYYPRREGRRTLITGTSSGN